MPTRGLPAFLEDIPEYEVRAGRMHILMGGLDIVMPIDVFLAGCRRGEAAIASWHKDHAGTAEIIHFHPQTKFERVYDPRGHI